MLDCWIGENLSGFRFGKRHTKLPHYIAFRKDTEDFNKVCDVSTDGNVPHQEVLNWLKETFEPEEVFYGDATYTVYFMFSQESYVALFKMRWL